MPLGTVSHESLITLAATKEHEEIKRLLKGGIKNIFAKIGLGILENTQKAGVFNEGISQQEESFHKNLDTQQILPAYTVAQLIKSVSENVGGLLTETGFYSEEGIINIQDIVKYRSYMYWVLQLLEKSGFKVNSEKRQKRLRDVPSNLATILSDILRDRALSTLLLVMKSYGLIDLSGNQINNYEIEEEVKVLNINKVEVIGKLKKLGAKKVFEGEVYDVYYDYPDGQKKLSEKPEGQENGIKSSFRIRTKIDKNGNVKHYYTVKRKLTKEEEKAYIDSGVLQEQTGVETRRCYEKELEIKDFKLFQTLISNFGLVKSREKRKQRISYSLENGNIKFDFDAYSGKQDMMEIEASRYSLVGEYIDKLGLQDHETMASGSEKFLKSEATNKQK